MSLRGLQSQGPSPDLGEALRCYEGPLPVYGALDRPERALYSPEGPSVDLLVSDCWSDAMSELSCSLFTFDMFLYL